MPTKNILVLVSILIIGAVLTVVFDKSHAPQDELLGKKIIQESVIPTVTKIEIKNEGKTLVLNKDSESRWSISQDDAFPASAEKIVKFFDSITKTKVIRKVSERKEKWPDLELDGQKSLILTTPTPVPAIILGKIRGGGGQYFRYSDEPSTSYMLDNSISLDTSIAAWELKTLVNVSSENIQKIEFHNIKKENQVTLTREKKGDSLVASGLDKDQQTSPDNLSTAERILTNFTYTGRSKKSESQVVFGKEPLATLTTFDGDRYDIKTAKKTEKPLKKDETPKEKFFIHISMKNAGETSATQARLLNELMTIWVFEFESYQESQFRKTRADFVKAKDPVKESISPPPATKGKG